MNDLKRLIDLFTLLIYFTLIYSKLRMTMLVGIKYAGKALIFADTRLAAGTSKKIHLDGFSKIFCIRNGFVSAAGLRGITNGKIRALNRSNIWNGAVEYTALLNRPTLNPVCAVSGLIFGLKNYLMSLTMPFDIRGNNPTGPPVLYLFSENGSYKPREYHKGDPCVIWPYGLDPEVKERLAIKFFTRANGNGSIEKAIERITAFYAETARYSPLISPDCRFAAFQADEEGNHLRGIGYSKVNKDGEITNRFAELPRDFNYRGWLRQNLVEKYVMNE